MIAALAAAWLAGAAPVPANELVPPLQLDGVEEGLPASALLPSQWIELEAAPAPEVRSPASEARGAATATGPELTRRPRRKSPPLALAITLACSLPTAFAGPSFGHLYAGDWKHFLWTGGGRLADLTLLVLLEKFAPGFGIGPLYALLNPEHLGKNFTGYPVGYPVDLVLVLALIGSAVYDAVDSWRAAVRFNDRFGLSLEPQAMSPAAAAAVPPRQ